MTGIAQKLIHAIDYGSDEYWETRYHNLMKKEGNLSKLEKIHESVSGSPEEILFDWYQTWGSLKDHLHPILKRIRETKNRPLTILQVGCGNSTLGESLFMEGTFSIVADKKDMEVL